MFKNFAALGLSTGIRLLTGFVLFVLMVREWGADKFGEFMYLYSVAAILVLACEYGFSQQILREIGRAPARASVRMGEYFSAKTWLTFIAWALAITYLFVYKLSANQSITLIFLLAAGTLMSYSDFLMACFRATGHFSNETKIALKGNLAYSITVLIAIFLKLDATSVAAAFLVGRSIHFFITYLNYRRVITGGFKFNFRINHSWPTIKKGFPYGLDVAIGTAFISVDTIIISHVLDFESAGKYQAAARFLQGAALIPPIFAGLFIPKMAALAEEKNKEKLMAIASKLYWLMLAAGTSIAIIFAIGSFEVHWLYPDPSLKVVSKLLPWFGVLVLIRFMSAGQGITMTALGSQAPRAVIFLVALLILIVSAKPLLLKFGELGMIYSFCLSYGFLFLCFWAWTERHGVRCRVVLSTSVLVTLAATLLTMIINYN